MYKTISDFIKEWKYEAEVTQRVLDSLTDESLKQQVYAEGRTLGRIAWHFTTNIPDYLTKFGFVIDAVENKDTVPLSAKEIAETFQKVSFRVAQIITEQWNSESLNQVQDAFGRQETNASIIMLLIKHIVHHRGQITILMRQAGLEMPWVYGPPKEGWVHLGVQTPPL